MSKTRRKDWYYKLSGSSTLVQGMQKTLKFTITSARGAKSFKAGRAGEQIGRARQNQAGRQAGRHARPGRQGHAGPGTGQTKVKKIVDT